jgi:hypothetical protein
VRALRLYPDAPFAGAAIAALNRCFTPENVAGELAYPLQFRAALWRGLAAPVAGELREQATEHTDRWRTGLASLNNQPIREK